MGMNLGIRKTTFSNEDQSWLGSKVGTNDADSVTLDAAACIAIAEFAAGTVPSGVPLHRAASGRYAPALDNGAGADDSIDGFLLHTVDLTAGGTQTAANTPVAMMWRGEIIVAKIPAYTGKSGIAALAANTTTGLFRFV